MTMIRTKTFRSSSGSQFHRYWTAKWTIADEQFQRRVEKSRSSKIVVKIGLVQGSKPYQIQAERIRNF
jgi:hypothetical protein